MESCSATLGFISSFMEFLMEIQLKNTCRAGLKGCGSKCECRSMWGMEGIPLPFGSLSVPMKLRA